MASLHQQYNRFNTQISLNKDKKASLITSRNSLKEKIKKYFKEEKSDELQPKFWEQGSFAMNTTVNPIPVKDEDDKTLLKYDLDLGIYFIENEDEDNRKNIDTWHNWVFNAVENHTNTAPPVRKNTCVRVIFNDGHHIDLPIYYVNDDKIELAHKNKGWIESDPKEFAEWFTNKAKENQQLRRIVRYLKAWKNYREIKNSNLRFPSGFALTILAVNNFSPNDRDDIALKETIEKIKETLDFNFECLRPTTPEGEDVFSNFSETRKNDFLNAIDCLLKDCQNALDEKNFKTASKYLRKHFGDRFPEGKDENEEAKSNRLSNALGATLASKPYAE